MKLINPYNKKVLQQDKDGWKDDEGNLFPVVNGILRIARGEDYAHNFGFQWNKFQETQIDREQSLVPISKIRFFAETNWDPASLKGQDILEVGCGAGRFTRTVLANTEANLYSIDLSKAVEANYRNNKQYGDRLTIVQASIYEMPFEDNSFDKIFCLGVLQHTPDARESIRSLVAKLKPGGELVLDFYTVTGWWTKIHAKYFFRRFTRRMAHLRLLSKIEKNVDWMIRLYMFNYKIGLGKILNRFLPIPDIKATMPDNLSGDELRNWVVLDMYDMLSPEYDKPQTIRQVKEWTEEAGMQVTLADFVHYDNARAAVVRAVKK